MAKSKKVPPARNGYGKDTPSKMTPKQRKRVRRRVNKATGR